MENNNEDHDQRLKSAVKGKPRDVIDLILPNWVHLFDYPHTEWVDKEFFPNPPKGDRRIVDLVAKIPTLQSIRIGDDKAEQCVGLIHVELEGHDPIRVMRGRMFDYRNMLRREYQLPVLPICIYTHVGLKGLGWDTYVETFFDQEINVFKYCYLGLPALDGLQYIKGENLLGVALSALMKIPQEKKLQARADAVEKILKSDEDVHRKYLLCEMVEAYMPLDEVQKQEYQDLLVTPKYPLARKYGKTSREEGIEEGIEKGIEKGIQKGIEKGIEKGELKGERKLIVKLLTERFGSLSSESLDLLENMNEEEIMKIGSIFYKAASLSELGLKAKSPS